MALSNGCHVVMLVYEKDRDIVTGYSSSLGLELKVKVHEDHGVFPADSLSFDVGKIQGQIVYPVDSSVRALQEVERARISGREVELAATVIHSSKAQNNYELWSPEFGYVLMGEDFHTTRDLAYSTYVKRDRSERAARGGYLFSVCNVLKQVEDDKKGNLINQMREAEEKRAVAESAGPSYGQTGFEGQRSGAWWRNQGLNDTKKEADERKMKLTANDVRSFLILNMKNQGPKTMGEAWASTVRTVAVTCEVLSGTTTRLQVGKWYEGVVKYSKRHHQKYNGFHVEKAWGLSNLPNACPTRFDSNGQVQAVMEVDFLEDKIKGHVKHSAGPPSLILHHTHLMSVQVTEKDFYARLGKRWHCALAFVPTNPDLCNWKVVEIFTDMQANAFVARSETVSEDTGFQVNDGDCDGVVADLDDDPYDDEEEEGLTEFKARPSPGLQRPVPHMAQGSVFSSFSNRNSGFAPQSDSGFTGRSEGGSHMFEQDEPVHDYGVVTEVTQRSSVIFSNSTQACVVRDIPLVLGDWVEFRARKLKRPEGGCLFEAIAETVQETDEKNPVFVDEQRRFILLDATVQMKYQPRKSGNYYKIYTMDVGWVYCTATIPLETAGSVSLGDMVNDGGEWRVWIQFIYDNETDAFLWNVEKVRGRAEDVKRRDSEADQRNLRNYAVDEDELEMEKQKAKAREEMERMNLNLQGSQSGRSGQNQVTSPAETMMTSASSLTNADLIALWKINEVRTAVKTTDFDLYHRIEDSVNDARTSTSRPPTAQSFSQPQRSHAGPSGGYADQSGPSGSGNYRQSGGNFSQSGGNYGPPGGNYGNYGENFNRPPSSSSQRSQRYDQGSNQFGSSSDYNYRGGPQNNGSQQWGNDGGYRR